MGLIPGLGRSPARVMAAYSSILAWKTSWTEEPSELQSRVRHNSSNLSIAQNLMKAYKKLVIKIAELWTYLMLQWSRLCIQCTGCGFDPWTGNELTRSHSKKKKKNVCMQNSLEKAMAPHSSTLAWRIPGMGEPGGLLFARSHRVGHD